MRLIKALLAVPKAELDAAITARAAKSRVKHGPKPKKAASA